MILRRVIDHVKAQNWTAVALDFVIVVMGVFIGIQVSNWNETRATRIQARAYLIELREDFRGNLTLAREASRGHVENIEAMLSLIEESAKAEPDGDAKSLNLSFQSIQSMPTFTPVTRAYDNLVGSGDLKIIANRELQDALARFSRLSGLAALIQNTHELELVNTFQPYIIANLDYAAISFDRSDGEFPLRRTFDDDRVLEVIGDREFRNVVIQKWTISVDLLYQTRALEAESAAIVAILDAELAGGR